MKGFLAELGLVAAACALIAASHAHAQGNHDGANKAWYAAQYNKAGQWCCDVSDGHEYDGDYAVNADGSVTIEPQGIDRNAAKGDDPRRSESDRPRGVVVCRERPEPHRLLFRARRGRVERPPF